MKNANVTKKIPTTIEEFEMLIIRNKIRKSLLNAFYFILTLIVCYILAFRVAELAGEITSDAAFISIISIAVMLVFGLSLIIYYFQVFPIINKYEKRIRKYELKINEILMERI